MKISQSFLKKYLEYLNGNVCGLQVKSMYVTCDYPQIEETSAIKWGNYWQFVAAGLLAKNGVIPVAELYKIGAEKGNPKPEFKLLERHGETFRNWMKSMSLTISKVNEYIEKGNYSGELDIDTNESYIIDLKSSSFIGNKWETFGWHIDRFRYAMTLLESGEIDKALNHCPHLIQALHYSMLRGKNLFIFYVVNPKNESDIFVTSLALADFVPMYEIWLSTQEVLIESESWDAKPCIANCFDCPLTCEFKSLLPVVEYV